MRGHDRVLRENCRLRYMRTRDPILLLQGALQLVCSCATRDTDSSSAGLGDMFHYDELCVHTDWIFSSPLSLALSGPLLSLVINSAFVLMNALGIPAHCIYCQLLRSIMQNSLNI